MQPLLTRVAGDRQGCMDLYHSSLLAKEDVFSLSLHFVRKCSELLKSGLQVISDFLG
jgi:hypothetical protein